MERRAVGSVYGKSPMPYSKTFQILIKEGHLKITIRERFVLSTLFGPLLQVMLVDVDIFQPDSDVTNFFHYMSINVPGDRIDDGKCFKPFKANLLNLNQNKKII